MKHSIGKKTFKSGFTLIELMIVVAIIGILAAIAIPAYMDYMKKTKVAEGLTLMGGIKTPALEYRATNGKFPENLKNLGVVTSGKYVDNIAVIANATNNGECPIKITIEIRGLTITICISFAFQAYYNGDLADRQVILGYSRDTNGWYCAGDAMVMPYLAKNCGKID